MRTLLLGGCFVFVGLEGGAQVLHGPNVNPSNFPVLVEWEKWTGQQAGMIGDNFSADTWQIFQEATSWQEERPRGAMAEQLRRWANAFDGNEVLEGSEGEESYPGRPRGKMGDYLVELAIPIFPGRMRTAEGDLVASEQVADRWQMGAKENRHHAEAKLAFEALAKALVEMGLGEAKLRLGWEFNGDWFPWGIDPTSEFAGSTEDFKAVWKLIYLTMEAVNPRFEWVWNSGAGTDHFDPSLAFPEFPEESFADPADDRDKILTDYVSVDFYDADGDAYFLHETGEGPLLEAGYWNNHPEEQKEAFDKYRKKIFEGRGHHAEEGQSRVYGLRYFRDFAQEKKLPFAVSEWGPWANFVPQRNSAEKTILRAMGYGGEDNPFFIEAAMDWFRENEVAYASLFEFYNGGEGDTVDHTLMPHFWNSQREGRPRVSFYAADSPYHQVTDQIHPRAARAYLQGLGTISEQE